MNSWSTSREVEKPKTKRGRRALMLSEGCGLLRTLRERAEAMRLLYGSQDTEAVTLQSAADFIERVINEIAP